MTKAEGQTLADGALDAEAFRANCALAMAQSPAGVAGLYGPGSCLWDINREAVIFAGGGRAALLQLAHPVVAQGVADFSNTRDSPLGRFIRTFEAVFAIVYGSEAEALRFARGVYRIHSKINGVYDESLGPYRQGQSYAALDPDALFWVHATLWDTTLWIYERCVSPLSDKQKQEYYEQTKRFALLFAVPQACIPPTYADFCEYMHEMLHGPSLQVLGVGREMAQFLFQARTPGVGTGLGLLGDLSYELLTPRLRQQFGVRHGGPQTRRANALLDGFRRVLPLVPRRLRYLPAYQDGMARCEGKVASGRIWNSRRFFALLKFAERAVEFGPG